jgi:hypothetical protein
MVKCAMLLALLAKTYLLSEKKREKPLRRRQEISRVCLEEVA